MHTHGRAGLLDVSARSRRLPVPVRGGSERALAKSLVGPYRSFAQGFAVWKIFLLLERKTKKKQPEGEMDDENR